MDDCGRTDGREVEVEVSGRSPALHPHALSLRPGRLGTDRRGDLAANSDVSSSLSARRPPSPSSRKATKASSSSSNNNNDTKSNP